MVHSKANTGSLQGQLNSGNRSSTELELATEMSQSWVSAALRGLIAQGHVVRIGARRGARYA